MLKKSQFAANDLAITAIIANFATEKSIIVRMKTKQNSLKPIRRMKRNILQLLSVIIISAITATSASAYKMTRVTVHDPSIVYDSSTGDYYIFGSHRGFARTSDLMNWYSGTAPWGLANDNGSLSNRNAQNSVAFKKNMTKTITKGGNEVSFGNFDAHAWSAAIAESSDGSKWNIDGNMWAPDVIYNKVMGKWCMYLSINGFKWNSSIILLTADRVNGPYVYQGPVVYSGFNMNSLSALSYKNTDLELVIGTQASLPARYNRGNKWGSYLPHCIDPCVFFDEEGQLWMSYGSWSGGIWMLKLNANNGLRDYDATYPVTGSGEGVTSDPYYGKKIAGGYYVSGEGSYIEHIGNHYFLFISNGGFSAAEGYQMRVFRSDKPDGPYKDANGVSAIYTRYVMNYGPNSDNRGVNIFGAYGEWGNVAVGNNSERSQGHNSIIAAEDGRTYLVYHTRFQNLGEGHQVRVHQVFQNSDGWLVAAPFEYTGETVTSADIPSTQQVADNNIPGKYKLLVHKYGLNHTNKELATPVQVQLNRDGSVTGAMSGRWKAESGTSYFTLTLGGVEYKGVMVEQMMEPKNDKVSAFTAMSKVGVTVWGYREEALPEESQTSDINSGLCAYYNFEATPIVNQLNSAQTATLGKEGTNTAPKLQNAASRNSMVLHTNFGAEKNTSYAKMPNPLYGTTLSDGMTIAMWVNVATENLWDALFSFFNPQTTARIFMTGNTYIGYNSMSGNWIDLNHSSAVTTKNLNFDTWNFITITLSRKDGFTIYVDGTQKAISTCNGEINGTTITSAQAYDYNLITDHIQQSSDMYLGFGSFWGSANALFDELLVYNRPLTAEEAQTLYQKELTVGSFPLGIDAITFSGNNHSGQFADKTFDLTAPQKGIYIRNGRKYVVR